MWKFSSVVYSFLFFLKLAKIIIARFDTIVDINDVFGILGQNIYYLYNKLIELGYDIKKP